MYSPERGDTRATDLAINDRALTIIITTQATHRLIYGRLSWSIDKHDCSIANYNFIEVMRINNNIINEVLAKIWSKRFIVK